MNRQSGNVFFIIFIGIALFAALGYAVSQSMRTGSNAGQTEKSTMLATDIISYGNSIATAVKTMMVVNGCKETQITFEDNNGTSYKTVSGAYDYTNSNAPTDKTCHVFNPAGGGVTPRIMSQNATLLDSDVAAHNMAPKSWIAQYGKFNGIGTETGAEGADLILGIGFLKKEVCIEINNKLGITNPSGNPPTDTWAGGRFVGTYADSANDFNTTATQGKKAFCGTSTGGDRFMYYQVLIAR
ncbi:MAG: hypothetical protein DI586_01115 [Micavibrio aeruginosavorus]|uniref:Uncharacterized protein n=1 Tax=Micavibrio aeruginosavorus TaxID=349221 RepID=A0A2W5HNM7_9BACT|nr:MAG: hypothetical protein DI586_01115 [Micavibrio aeruginosavorus]